MISAPKEVIRPSSICLDIESATSARSSESPLLMSTMWPKAAANIVSVVKDPYVLMVIKTCHTSCSLPLSTCFLLYLTKSKLSPIVTFSSNTSNRVLTLVVISGTIWNGIIIGDHEYRVEREDETEGDHSYLPSSLSKWKTLVKESVCLSARFHPSSRRVPWICLEEWPLDHPISEDIAQWTYSELDHCIAILH